LKAFSLFLMLLDFKFLENFKRHRCHETTRLVHGLAKGVREDSRMNAEEKQAGVDAKKKDPRMFAPEGGGQYAVF
jgi:hypothetical protein